MTYATAKAIMDDYYALSERTRDDEFAFTEALGWLIGASGEPKYMTELAWFYCERKRFDLEQKYLEMAAECGYGPAFEELGYMFYYGQNGEKDYRKAFEYFSKGALPDRFGNGGSLWCRYKIADMYRFGCYVEKDEERYRELIEEAYAEVRNPHFLNEPFPEIAYRLAGIRAGQGRTEEAVGLLQRAKRFMAERLSYEPFWGHIEVMGRIVRLLRRLAPLGGDEADFYDLFDMTQRPGRYAFTLRGERLVLEVSGEGEAQAIAHDGKFYRDFGDICRKMTFSGEKLTALYDEIYDVQDLPRGTAE